MHSRYLEVGRKSRASLAVLSLAVALLVVGPYGAETEAKAAEPPSSIILDHTDFDNPSANGPYAIQMPSASQPLPIVIPPEPAEGAGQLSPDGLRMAVSESVVNAGKLVSGSFSLMDAYGGNVVEVWTETSADVGRVSWSPDSSRVVFSVVRLNQDSVLVGASIYVVNSDGTNLVLLTPAPVWDDYPTWSPDGSRIAFSSTPPGGNADILMMRPDGSDRVSLAVDPDVIARQPEWSPDSSVIAYIGGAIPAQTGVVFDYKIYSVDVASKVVTKLTTGPADESHAFSIRGRNNPQSTSEYPWSFDGSKLVFTVDSDADGYENLFTIDSDGSNRNEITAGGGSRAYLAVWSPHDTRIAFSAFASDFSSRKIYIANGDGTGVVNISSGPYDAVVTWVSGYVVPPGDAVVGLVDPTQGQWHLYDDAGQQTSSFFFGNPGDFPIVGDWDCDGVETPGMYRQSDGFVYLRNSNTQGVADIKFFFGNPGDVPIAGDFNNDGCGTVSIYRPSNQTFYIINKLGENNGGLGAAEFSYVFGNPGDKPFVGDFDGDGTETVGLHRESTGLVYFRNSHTQGNADAQFIFGNPGDRLVAGDWNSDGMFSPALFRPSNTTMYSRYTNTQGNADNQFIPIPNGADWLPVAGAFD